MGEILKQRRGFNSEKLTQFEKHIDPALCRNAACVYVTGSYGRLEASQHSDIDTFIVGLTAESGDGKTRVRRFSHLDEILLQAEIIEAAKREGFPPFSKDGEYLNHLSLHQLTSSLGEPWDDIHNTLTARVLLLLESRPLLCEPVYKHVIDEVIGAYWTNFANHSTHFMPGFLINDIQRMWRTMCVNYEARTDDKTDTDKAKRKLKNYKLKHSRLLTCYSALLFLLNCYAQRKTVIPDDVRKMVSLTPTERLENLLTDAAAKSAHDDIHELLKRYEEFLGRTDEDEKKLVEMLKDKKKSEEFTASAHKFGDVMKEALEKLGSDTLFYRVIVV